MKEKQALRIDRRLAIFVSTLAVCLCLGYGWFRAELPAWWKSNGGGVPYVLFFVTFFFVLLPERRSITLVTCLAVAWACAAEFFQLYKGEWLVQFRSTQVGAALLGSSFTWSDFPPYFIGGGLGYLFLLLLFWLVDRKHAPPDAS